MAALRSVQGRHYGRNSMEYPARKHPRLKTYDYSQNGGYFITICAQDRMPLFWTSAKALSSVGKITLECLREIPAHFPDIVLDTHCVMPDHVHMILLVEHVGPPYMAADRSKQTISHAVQQFKAAVSRRSGRREIWQPGFYDHIIRNEDDRCEIRKYIQENPLKWIIDKD